MASRTARRRTTYRALGRHQQRRSRPIVTFFLVALAGFTMLTSGASAATILFYGQNLPSLKNFKSRFEFQNTVIRDRFGHVLYDMADVSKGRGRRVVEPLVEAGHSTAWYKSHGEAWLVGTAPRDHGIPLVLQDATIATEDATFYSNPGFDPLSIIRAEYDNLTRGSIVSGASTITQQLVRDYMLSSAPTISRKTEEIILAAELTQKYPKSQILWYYLNSVPYGNLSYGAEAASKTYFGKDVWHLTLPEAAFLAGLPEAPSTYDPVNNLPVALERMHYVLYLMYQHGYLLNAEGKPDKSLINQAMAQTKGWHFRPATVVKRDPHFVNFAINQLEQIPQLRGRIYNGLDVYTTLDQRLQDQAQAIVRNQIASLVSQNVTDGALVSMSLDKSCYGCILAMVGSPNYNDVKHSGQINMADSPRQPGSSFKPFNYVDAFMHGLGPGTTVDDGPLAIPDPGNASDGGWYEPENYDHLWHGVVTLRVALDNSLNIPAVKVEQYNASISPNGLQGIENVAYRMGMTSIKSDNPHCCGWSLTLGGLERGTRLVEETAAYGAFGTAGRTVPPIAIWKVYDRTTGKLLYDASKPQDLDQNPTFKSQQVIDPAYAYLMNNVLSDNASRCTPSVCEFGLDSPLNVGRTAAAKTGTTNSFTDNWTVGYTPDIVTGVWVGNADNSPMIDSTGITGAAPIWHDYMLKAFSILNLPPKDFTQPPDVYFGSQCRLPGPYTSFSSTVYDVYAGTVPYCSVGTAGGTLPVPQSSTDSSGTGYTAPAVATAPVPVAAPTVAPTVPAPVQAPAVPGVQPGNAGAVTQPTSPPVVAQPTVAAPVVQPTSPAPIQPAPVATTPPVAQPQSTAP